MGGLIGGFFGGHEWSQGLIVEGAMVTVSHPGSQAARGFAQCGVDSSLIP
jgi:hypothetical protein